MLEQTVERLDQGIVRRLMLGYHRLYLLITMSLMRDHERQADVWSGKLDLVDGERVLVTWGGYAHELGAVGESLRGALEGRPGGGRDRGT